MHPAHPYPDEGFTITRHTQRTPTPAHAYPDRGLIHLLPALAFGLGGIAYPLYVFVTMSGAPAQVTAALQAVLAGCLIAGFVSMLGYVVVRLGRTRRTLVLQYVGLGVTLLGAIAGLALVFTVTTT